MEGGFSSLPTKGEILIYCTDCKLNINNKFTLGTHLDAIEAGPGGDILRLISRKNKTVHVITVNFIYDINVSGSHFKGPADAPVVMAVFNDYQ
jgi:hypothetical protein